MAAHASANPADRMVAYKGYVLKAHPRTMTLRPRVEVFSRHHEKHIAVEFGDTQILALHKARRWVDEHVRMSRAVDQEFSRTPPTSTPVYFVDENPIGKGAKIGLVVGGVVALGALVWALWPATTTPASGPAGGAVVGGTTPASLTFVSGQRYQVTVALSSPIPASVPGRAQIKIPDITQVQNNLNQYVPGVFTVVSADVTTDASNPVMVLDCVKTDDLTAAPASLADAFLSYFAAGSVVPVKTFTVKPLGPTPPPPAAPLQPCPAGSTRNPATGLCERTVGIGPSHGGGSPPATNIVDGDYNETISVEAGTIDVNLTTPQGVQWFLREDPSGLGYTAGIQKVTVNGEVGWWVGSSFIVEAGSWAMTFIAYETSTIEAVAGTPDDYEATESLSIASPFYVTVNVT